MIVAVPKEIAAGERRVALVPQACGQLVARGLEVIVESGAGDAACFRDEDYDKQGAAIKASTEGLYSPADVVLKVQPPEENEVLGKHEAELLKEGATLVSFLYPLQNLQLVERLVERRITSFAMELMPRITRAQSMDALSSMSSIAGYKAVLLAANLLPRYFPMLMTAAGTIPPARVLVLGAGVAGLQAIATAKRLGAVVEAYDIRPVVKEQVESLGARFVDLDVDTSEAQEASGYAREQTENTQERLRASLTQHVARANAVITTALVPGKQAPLLLTEDMVRAMKPGSVVVDLAAEQGGNCELTEAGNEIVRGGVIIAGPLNLVSEVAVHASELYSRNVSDYFLHLYANGEVHIDVEDELTGTPLVTREGEIVHEPTRAACSEKSEQ
ncbi:MAG: Re/Si-specific NAD(P)(+) transhydrogenase subunit alpha [Planctomycetota bacterium]|nr:Re/Si-specific NAD(P)(+) transhydrogenase subunit alpha [Planctomycetota bacterium]